MYKNVCCVCPACSHIVVHVRIRERSERFRRGFVICFISPQILFSNNVKYCSCFCIVLFAMLRTNNQTFAFMLLLLRKGVFSLADIITTTGSFLPEMTLFCFDFRWLVSTSLYTYEYWNRVETILYSKICEIFSFCFIWSRR